MENEEIMQGEIEHMGAGSDTDKPIEKEGEPNE